MAEVEIIIKTIDQSTGQTAKAATGLEKFAKGISKAKDIALSAAPAIATMYKAFDFAEQGTKIKDLRNSFEGLGFNINELREAARGTVSDFDLMASANKLVAGTTGELKDAMSAAAPALLEVARAAVKLDPTIGSVAFVYESLAKGIKKNQPLLIDNANIAVKVGQANEKMAEQLGKSVSELTEEEKAIALLNDTLRAGDALMEQVGGTADSNADAFGRLRAEVQNAATDFKEWLGEGISPIVGGFFDMKDAGEELNDELIRSSDTLDEYLDKWAELTPAQKIGVQGMVATTEEAFRMRKEMMEAANAIEQVAEAGKEVSNIRVGFDFEAAGTASAVESQMQSMFDKLEFSLNPDALKIAGDVNLLQQLIGEGKIDPSDGLAALEELKEELAGALSEEGLAEGIFAGLSEEQFADMERSMNEKLLGPIVNITGAVNDEGGLVSALGQINDIKFEKLEEELAGPIKSAKTVALELNNTLQEMVESGFVIDVVLNVVDTSGAVLPESE
jgi:hypothetical protein